MDKRFLLVFIFSFLILSSMVFAVDVETGEEKIVLTGFVEKDDVEIIRFKEEHLGIIEMSLEFEKNVNIEIIIEKISIAPGLSEDMMVYKYFNISKENFTNDDLKTATMNFIVNRDWIYKHKINDSSISLYRYSRRNWNKLSTSLLNEFGDYNFYKSEFSDFSYFAIAGEKIGLPCISGEKRCSGNNVEQCKEDNSGWEYLETCYYGCELDECLQEIEEFEEESWVKKIDNLDLIVCVLIILGLIIIVGVVFWYFKEKKK